MRQRHNVSTLRRIVARVRQRANAFFQRRCHRGRPCRRDLCSRQRWRRTRRGFCFFLRVHVASVAAQACWQLRLHVRTHVESY